MDSNDSKTKSPLNDNDVVKSIDSTNEQGLIQSFEAMNSKADVFKSIPDIKSIVSKLTKENEKLLNDISNVRIVIGQALKSQKCLVRITRKEMMTKLETIEAEKETFRRKTKVLDEENKSLEEENCKLRHEVSTLKSTKSKLTLELKDLEKDMEDLQENLKNLREENRKLLKEAKWKSVGKQGGYQESLIIQEWEKKLKKLEADYETLRRVKKVYIK
jgi:chromosome segregation ATPase